ncbi:1191_t:CDS:1, partial [Dentiscutata erythropus]
KDKSDHIPIDILNSYNEQVKANSSLSPQNHPRHLTFICLNKNLTLLTLN